MIDDRAMFADIGECLRWAFYGSVDAGCTVQGPSYVQLQKRDDRDKSADAEPPPARNPDLSPKPRGRDASAQAGMILRVWEALPELYRCATADKHLRGPHQALGRRNLRPMIIDRIIITNDMERRVALMLMQMFYGRKLTIDAIAVDLKVNRRHVTSLNESLLTEFSYVYAAAETDLYKTLWGRGVLL